MKYLSRILIASVCLAAGACAMDAGPTSSANMAELSGTAMYRERMALPAGARLVATIEDVSRADAASTVVAQTAVEPAGHPPIRFTIPYDAARLEASHEYAVRARITHDGQLLFTTAERVRLPPPGQSVQLMLVRAGGGAAGGGAAGAPTATLENTYWKLLTLGETPVTVDAQREPHFILHPDDKRISGHAGCNRLTGGYELAAERLTFTRAATTMMACTDGMQFERPFLDALIKTARWQIQGERLTLVDDAGTKLAEFESRYMR